MPGRNDLTPQRRFLVRGSILLAGMLFVWWLVLIDPLLAALRFFTGLALRCLPGAGGAQAARLLANGDWVLRVPVPSTWLGLPMTAQTPSFRGIQLQLPRYSLILFTLGFPIFWALMLSDLRGRRVWKTLLAGTAILGLIAVAQVVVFVGYTLNTTLHFVSHGMAAWVLNYVNYLNTFLIPYTVPFCVALFLHPELRATIFSSDASRLATKAASRTARVKR